MEAKNTVHRNTEYDSAASHDILYCLIWSVIALVVTIGSIRLYSSFKAPIKATHGTLAVPLIPYWTPFLGHALYLVLRPDRLLTGMRLAFPHGICSIVLGGSIHNIIWSPSLSQAIFSQRSSIIDFPLSIWHVLANTGGVSSFYEHHYEKAYPSLKHAVTNSLLKDASLSTAIGITIGNIKDQLPNLVTFCESYIDQMPWERPSDAKLMQDRDFPVMEVNLLPLIFSFTGYCAIPSILGDEFLRNYPDILSDQWKLNSGFVLLVSGLPRWIPIPSLSAAYGAHARILTAITDLHAAMDMQTNGRDPGTKWENLDRVSQLLKDRHAIYQENDIPPAMRAPEDLAILWAMNANSNYLVFWLLVRILSDADLTTRIRAETSAFIVVDESKGEFGHSVYEAPRLSIFEKELATKCPLLKSCYIECLRLDSSPWSLKKVLQDFIITESPIDSLKRGELMPQSYSLKAGTFVDIPFNLHFTDPHYFPEPNKFIPDRHIVKRDENGVVLESVEFGTVRPYGGGQTMCEGRLFAERVVSALVAGILALWDIEPADKKGWKIPRHEKAAAVNIPKDDLRVRIRRRVYTAHTGLCV